jgi:hypothetical protein
MIRATDCFCRTNTVDPDKTMPEAKVTAEQWNNLTFKSFF